MISLSFSQKKWLEIGVLVAAGLLAFGIFEDFFSFVLFGSIKMKHILGALIAIEVWFVKQDYF